MDPHASDTQRYTDREQDKKRQLDVTRARFSAFSSKTLSRKPLATRMSAF